MGTIHTAPKQHYFLSNYHLQNVDKFPNFPYISILIQKKKEKKKGIVQVQHLNHIVQSL